MRRLRDFAPAVLFVLGLVLVQSAQRQRVMQLSQPLRVLPLTVAGISGEDRTVPAAEVKAAGVNDYVFRIFQQDSARAFSLYVGYYESQATGRTIHSPRNCLPGGGWQIVESGDRYLSRGNDSVRVNRYIIANGSAQAIVYYWYQGRGRVAYSEYGVKWDLLRDAAQHGRTEEALVRIMVPIPPAKGYTAADWQQRVGVAEQLAREAATELLPAIDRALPRWSPKV